MFISKRFYMFSGKHDGETNALVSFDSALINAGIDCYNLVKVSSIIPPFFERSRSIDVDKGNILYTAFASTTQKGAGLLSAAIAIGLPLLAGDIGVIMEYSCDGTEQEALKVARSMVKKAMENRNLVIKEILCVSSSTSLSQSTYSTVIAGVALW